MVAAQSTDRVRKAPCPHNPEEDLEVKKRVKRDVKPPEVRRFRGVPEVPGGMSGGGDAGARDGPA